MGFATKLIAFFNTYLISLKYNARIISARVFDVKNGYGFEFDHLAIVVEIDYVEYLMNVGFGEFIFEPLKVALDIEQKDPRGDFIIDCFDDGYLSVNKIVNSKLKPEYIFRRKERKLNDFKEMCEYHQTSPDSNFTKKKLITLPTENGRITISGDTIKVKEGDSNSERKINRYKLKMKNRINFNIAYTGSNFTEEEIIAKGHKQITGKKLHVTIINTTVYGDYPNGYKFVTDIYENGSTEGTNDVGSHNFGTWTIDYEKHTLQLEWKNSWIDTITRAYEVNGNIEFYDIDTGYWRTTFKTLEKWKK